MDRRWKTTKIVWRFLVLAMLAVGCAQRADEVPPEATPAPTRTDAPGEPTSSPSPTPVQQLTTAVVAVSPPSGPPGTEVQVVAAGFPPDLEIELGAGRVGAMQSVLITERSSADGFVATKLGIPDTAKPEEAWVIVASTAEGDITATSNVFQVTAPQYRPQVSIAPTSGPPGTDVQVTAEGLPPATSVAIGLGRQDSEYDIVGSFASDGEGSLTARVALPGYAEPAERWVAVVTTDDGSVKAVSNVFQVTQEIYQGTVAISPRSGPPGTRVQVAARGFPPNGAVSIGVGRPDSEYDVVASAESDSNGRVDAEIVMPDFVEPGDRWVIVVAAVGQPAQAISDEFDVTPGATATPRQNLFTRTNIYLIAIGDEGRSGKAIGCGDSVVPVEVAIEPTIAPLTAALNKLLSITSREYGMSGYYNALFQSRLTLDGVSIEDRVAIIRLSGVITLGGVCDEPRVQAQLQQTALQYATVDRVSIFVNGTPLEELLGEG